MKKKEDKMENNSQDNNSKEEDLPTEEEFTKSLPKYQGFKGFVWRLLLEHVAPAIVPLACLAWLITLVTYANTTLGLLFVIPAFVLCVTMGIVGFPAAVVGMDEKSQADFQRQRQFYGLRLGMNMFLAMFLLVANHSPILFALVLFVSYLFDFKPMMRAEEELRAIKEGQSSK